MAKVLFFTKGAVPTTAEKAMIERLEARDYVVGVRNGSVDTKHGSKLETHDFVAGTIPSAYALATLLDIGPAAKPEKLQAIPATKALSHPATQQLQVLAANIDDSTGAITLSDVTAAAAGTTYVSSVVGAATVNAAGLVSSVAPGTTTVTATHTSAAAVKAELDCGAVPTKQYDAVLDATTAGTAGNSITVALAGDSETGAGVTIARTDTAFIIHYEAGVSKVSDVNTAITALGGGDDLFGVKTAGTEARVLDANAAFPAQSLSGGAAATTSTSTCVVTVS